MFPSPTSIPNASRTPIVLINNLLTVHDIYAAFLGFRYTAALQIVDGCLTIGIKAVTIDFVNTRDDLLAVAEVKAKAANVLCCACINREPSSEG